MAQGQRMLLYRSPPGRESLTHKVLDATRRVWARYWVRRAEHATAAILHTLDDRALKDIGIDRSEIESVVCGERGREHTRLRERRLGMCH